MMRKRTVKYTADTIFWYSLYILPFIILVVSMFKLLGNDNFVSSALNILDYPGELTLYTFESACSPLFEWFSLSEPITSMFGSIFMELGFAADSFMFWFVADYLAYFVIVNLMHVCVDFLLFLPRLAHKWMNSFDRGAD